MLLLVWHYSGHCGPEAQETHRRAAVEEETRQTWTKRFVFHTFAGFKNQETCSSPCSYRDVNCLQEAYSRSNEKLILSLILDQHPRDKLEEIKGGSPNQSAAHCASISVKWSSKMWILCIFIHYWGRKQVAVGRIPCKLNSNMNVFHKTSRSLSSGSDGNRFL